MNLKNIFRYSEMLAVSALMACAATGLTSCNDDDDDFAGEPYFLVEGIENGIVPMTVDGEGNDDPTKWAFGGGDHYIVRANGKWSIVPVDGAMPDWMRIFPLEGEGDGILRFYAKSNPMAAPRTAVFKVILNGVEQPQTLQLRQDPSGPKLTLTADFIQLKQGGGFAEVLVSSNYEWTVEPDAEAAWLTVTRDDNKLTIGTDEANITGDERHGKVYLRGLEPNEDLVVSIDVTQLDAIWFEDFSWLGAYKGDTAPQGWLGTDLRIDKWTTDKDGNPEWATHGWSSVGNYTYRRYGYLKFGTGNNAGDVIAPAIEAIDGTIDAEISWNMVGYCSKKNVRDDSSLFYVVILGPGTITDVSNGTLQNGVAIPYKNGSEDVTITTTGYFELSKNACFDTTEETGLEVWKHPDSQFSIKVSGMDNTTRIAWICGDAPNMISTKWANGAIGTNRMFLDNVKVRAN